MTEYTFCAHCIYPKNIGKVENSIKNIPQPCEFTFGVTPLKGSNVTIFFFMRANAEHNYLHPFLENLQLKKGAHHTRSMTLEATYLLSNSANTKPFHH
jgi:hypothetical protein